jgi:hypothetical protein
VTVAITCSNISKIRTLAKSIYMLDGMVKACDRYDEKEKMHREICLGSLNERACLQNLIILGSVILKCVVY